MKNKQLLALPIGIILLGISLLMGRFLPATNLFDFLEGLLIGLSIALNIAYIFYQSRK
jgi:hypothetical protein